jgi:hypothetical protein
MVVKPQHIGNVILPDSWQPSSATPRRCGDGLQASRQYLYLYSGVVGETVTEDSPGLLAQHDGLLGLFHIALSEQSNVRELGDEGRLSRHSTLVISALLARHVR